MLWRCMKKCNEVDCPCEISTYEMDMMIGKSTPCPMGENNYFDLIDETNEFYCLVVGSRGFNNYDLMKEKLDFLLKNKQGKHIVIVSGGANGADSLAERYARENHYELVVFLADWNNGSNGKVNRGAGFIRNEKMHKFISTKEDRGVVAFWDGVSKGTAHSFDLSKKYNNPLKVIRF